MEVISTKNGNTHLNQAYKLVPVQDMQEYIQNASDHYLNNHFKEGQQIYMQLVAQAYVLQCKNELVFAHYIIDALLLEAVLKEDNNQLEVRNGIYEVLNVADASLKQYAQTNSPYFCAYVQELADLKIQENRSSVESDLSDLTHIENDWIVVGNSINKRGYDPDPTESVGYSQLNLRANVNSSVLQNGFSYPIPATLYIKKQDGKFIPYYSQNQFDTVADVKRQIELDTEIPASEQKLMYLGKEITGCLNAFDLRKDKLMLINKQSIEKQNAQTIRKLTTLAEKGDVNAQFELGVHYMEGKITQQSNSKTIHYLMLAFEHGHTEAAFTLYESYTLRSSWTKDDESEKKWLRIAAETGHPEANFVLAKLYATAKKMSVGDFLYFATSAHSLGHKEAALFVANWYAKNPAPTDSDKKIAYSWFEKAVKVNGGRPIHAEGWLKEYAEKFFKAEDTLEDLVPIIQRANQGDPAAQFYLGKSYLKNHTEMGRNLGFSYITEALLSGYAPSYKELNELKEIWVFGTIYINGKKFNPTE